MSSWFGRSSTPEPAAPKSSTYGDSSTSSYDSFDSSSYSSPAPPPSSGNALQEAVQLEQQKMAIQGAIQKLSDICFDICVTRPGDKLSGSEQSCIQNCSDRYFETSMFVMQRMSKSQR